MDELASAYVKLVLAVGTHDADYVDAYYGPPAWRDEARAENRSVAEIQAAAIALREKLAAVEPSDESLDSLRLDYLRRQNDALITRTEMLLGRRLSFDDESHALYDAVAPTRSEEHFRGINAGLDVELPGSGPLAARLEAFRAQFIIAPEKLHDVFSSAIEICRGRTLEHIQLPAEETFTVEYVNDKAWSGYNWYRGRFESLIQVNTDLPIFIDRAIDLACHEGYPGHHVYNALIEKALVHDRGWLEFSVYPLFSPQSLIAEGSANYGIDVAFPGQERIEIESDVLFPAAGLDPSRAAHYYRVHELISLSSYAGNEAARRYLDGEISADDAAEWLTTYALMEPARARQRIRFFEQYRSYVINYNLGQDLVRNYVERHTGGDGERRWQVFAELLSSPRLPSGLR